MFGTMRPDYGPFNITLDGKATSHSAMTSNNTDFQQVLFSAPTLSSETHELVLTNTGKGTYVDIDFITFTTGDGDGRWVIAFLFIFKFLEGHAACLSA